MADKTGFIAAVDRFGEEKTFVFAYEVGHIGLRSVANDSVFSVISNCCLRHIAL